MDLLDFQHLREGNRLEAKSAAGGLPTSVWETYSAFANTEGGTILLGVEEERSGALRISGLAHPERTLRSFWTAINNPSKVSHNILTNDDVAIVERDELKIVAVSVPRATSDQRPVYLNGNPLTGSYRRNGEGDYRCSELEVRAMIRDAGSYESDKLPLEQFDLSALNAETVRRYRNVLAAERPGHPWIELGDEDFLLRLGAATLSRTDARLHPTRAGLLMFGNDYEITREFPRYLLDYRESLGHERWDDRLTSGTGEWSGNLFDFWREVLPRVQAGVRRPFQTVDGLRVEDNPMHKAVREALANCLVHADYYGDTACVVVRNRNDALFSNPGTMRIAPNVALAGGVSNLRNPTLMTMFSLLNVVEKAGSGFDTMRRGLAWAGLPDLELEERYLPDRVEVRLPLRKAVEAGAEYDAPDTRAMIAAGDASALSAAEGLPGEGLTDDERRVVALAQSGQSFTRQDVERLLGVGPGTAKKLLAKLVSEGVVVRDGASRATRYHDSRMGTAGT